MITPGKPSATNGCQGGINMIKYVAQITCDGQDCNSIISTNAWEQHLKSRFQANARAIKKSWVFINYEHYCPKCAEVYKCDKQERPRLAEVEAGIPFEATHGRTRE